MNNKTLTEEIGRIKIRTIQSFPYLYGLTKGVDIKVIKGKMKAETDGRYVYMSEDLVKNRDLNYGIYIHELLHIALLHVDRIEGIGKEINMKLYNFIADYHVNRIILEKRIPLHKNSITSLNNVGFDEICSREELNDYRTYGIEFLYNKILPHLPNGINDSEYKMDVVGNDKGENDKGKFESKEKRRKDLIDDECNHRSSNNEDKLKEEEIESMLREGQLYGKMMGSGKGTFEEMIDVRLNKIIKWDKLVLENSHKIFKKKNDYSRIHKKSNYNNYPLIPRRRNEKGKKFFIGIDTSGSMNTESIMDFLGSLCNLVKSNNAILDIMECDSEKQDVIRIKNKKELNQFNIKGRGGTSFKPFIDYITENKCDMGIIFTDGYGDQRALEYKGRCKIFWIITNNGDKEGFNFGRVIESNIR